MDIVWDEEKNDWLITNRSVSFNKIAGMLLEDDYIDIVENRNYPDQLYFIMNIQNYTWLVPFLIDEKERIVLKTAFPSRKYHRIYGDKR